MDMFGLTVMIVLAYLVFIDVLILLRFRHIEARISLLEFKLKLRNESPK